MKISTMIYVLQILLILSSCDLFNKNDDFRSNVDKVNENLILSEELKYQVDTIADGLSNPWALTFLPNNDLLVTERDGEIRIIRDNKLLENKITGVPDVYAEGQGGLFEILLHPYYLNNGWLYISYASRGDGGGNTAIMRAKLDGFDLVDKEVIFQAKPFLSGGNHFGGRMEFDREGFLYLSIGERGRKSNAQDRENHCGKVVRLNDDGSIPSDNPFISEAGVKPEIYTYGNRNPQGMAIHPITGQIWTHEHGPMGGDEINIVKAGLNFGWPEATFGKNYDGTIISDYSSLEGMADPLHYWDPSIAPCGMSFVTSDLFPQWKGNLLVGSLKFRYVARLTLEGETVVNEEKIIENLGRVRSIVEGPDGLIYVSVESPGMVVRISPE